MLLLVPAISLFVTMSATPSASLAAFLPFASVLAAIVLAFTPVLAACATQTLLILQAAPVGVLAGSPCVPGDGQTQNVTVRRKCDSTVTKYRPFVRNATPYVDRCAENAPR